ncbi:MAG: protein kinase [Nitrospira sp.]|jgi:serine/threonine protein kinase|nr:protein kinase [Nitrospira sp.]
MTTRTFPHELLEGLTLANDWHVLKRVEKHGTSTGGFFSCGYIAQHKDGKQGYVKALDFFSRLSDHTNPAVALKPYIDAFVFECDLLHRCRDRKLSRVVTALDDGAVTVPGIPPPSTVQYIIFELADGDIRSQLAKADQVDIAWMFRSLHHIALGVEQLHSINVAHQDLKPSNVLVFDDASSSKIADVGRAAARGVEPPHYDLVIPGEQRYAPPELLYGSAPSSWEARRMGCDAYLLGSMISSFFTTLSMTQLIQMTLDERFHWLNWHGTYEEVLPYLRAAFADALDYSAHEFPAEFRSELREALSQLCDPDPSLRGHPRDRSMKFGNPFSLQRYVSLFNLLASRAEIGLRT